MAPIDFHCAPGAGNYLQTGGAMFLLFGFITAVLNE
jgi:hypothetical protein